MKRDYYEVLEVDQNCPQEQIIKAYRKQALRWHPDKNTGDENARQVFQEIQEAYSVLSDPNERTWYDNHKAQILNPNIGKEDLETMEGFGFNIWEYFQPRYAGFGDDPKGFYAFFREAFEKIKIEEEKAYNNRQLDSEEEASDSEFEKLPGFGMSTTPIDQVLRFYSKWENFTTYKKFAYADKYNPKEAPNRQVKRIIVAENLKERKEEKKKYIKTVKKLVETVKLRDPRYKEFQEQLKKEQALKEQLKKKQQEQLKQELVEVRKQALLAEQERFRENEEYFKEQQRYQVILQDEKPKKEDLFYCDVCDKEFKSESQFKNHQGSKLHKQNLKDLVNIISDDVKEKETLLQQAGVLKQNDLSKTEQQIQEQVEKEVEKQKQRQAQQEQLQQQQMQKKKKKQRSKKAKSGKNLEDDAENVENPQFQSEKAPNEERPGEESSSEDEDLTLLLKNTKKSANNSKPVQKTAEEEESPQKGNPKSFPKEQPSSSKFLPQRDSDSEPENEGEAKDEGEETRDKGEGSKGQDPAKQLNKAKIKRNKKKEQQKQQQQEVQLGGQFKCKVCAGSYPSKTKLFNHLNESGHKALK